MLFLFFHNVVRTSDLFDSTNIELAISNDHYEYVTAYTLKCKRNEAIANLESLKTAINEKKIEYEKHERVLDAYTKAGIENGYDMDEFINGLKISPGGERLYDKYNKSYCELLVVKKELDELNERLSYYEHKISILDELINEATKIIQFSDF